MSDTEIVSSSSNKALLLIREVLFFSSLGFFLFKRLFCDVTLWNGQNPFWGEVDQQVDQICESYVPFILIACIVFAFFTTVPKLTRLLACAALIAIGKLVAVANEDSYFFVMTLLIVAAVGISAKKILTFTIGLNIPFLLYTVISSQIGRIENRIDPGRHREYLGYNWTTTPVMIFTYAVFAYLVLRKGKITIWEYLFLNAANFWFFYKTNTRFAFLIIFLLLTFLMVYRAIRDHVIQHSLYRNLFVVIPELCFIFVYGITMLYDPNSGIMLKLDSILSHRLRQCQYSIGKYGLLPFGQPITWVTIGQSTPDNPATYVDTAYLQTLLKFGYVTLIALLLLSSYILYRSFKEKKYALAIVFGCVLVFGLFEQQPFWAEYDVILLLAFADWAKIRDFSHDMPQIGLNRQL